MLTSLTRAIAQLPDPRFRRVLRLGLVATLVLYALLYLAVGWGLAGLQPFGIGWVDLLTDLLGGFGIFIVTLLLFPSVATLLQSFLLDDIADAVEARHYPGLPPPRDQGLIKSAMSGLRLGLLAIAINLLALPFYGLLLLAGIGIGLYYLINGYLLARDYFEMAALRRMTVPAAHLLLKRHRLRLWGLGLVIAFLSTLPLVNLVAPLIATAAMIHEVEALRSRYPDLQSPAF